ncbi:hypothetical protein HD600_002665 [Microbacterium ginsengiterrae]|uniref:AbiEi antitoxin C-terminal domain-containing protein n=1 Tax=Microbacterium ginsengiterrae TaxID=546115 RepID=A0A7W9CEV4_9MICO|nr:MULTISPECIES: hypothetical protein [Microbacterium]MBB5744168.1 hypothetical protein [Microbacterium ginsengiterrae]
MSSSLILHPGALLSLAELTAARIDGVLIEVGDAFMPPDLPEDAAARAASLARLLPAGHALCDASAAWVHGFGDSPPVRHRVQRVSSRRGRVRMSRHVIVHERRIGQHEVQTVGSVLVTTPLRTLTDLVLSAGDDEESATRLRTVAAAAGDLVPQARSAIAARSRMPGKHAAIARLDRLTSTTR